jgi:hypothetical protein
VDPQTADLIKVALGAAAAFLGKSGLDYLSAWRQGKTMKEAGLVSNLQNALGREEEDHGETRDELRVERMLLNYWRSRSGHLEYILSQRGIDFPPASPPEPPERNEA